MIFEPRNPTPCTTPLGDGYVWYVKCGGFLENDEITVILLDGGIIRHFESGQVKIWHNETYGIKKQNNAKKASKET
jgi:hypothetical protein